MEDQKQNPEQPQQAWNPMLVFHLSLADVNAVLGALGKAPLENAMQVYMALRSDTERQLATLQANMDKAEAAPKEDGAGE